MLAVHKSQSLRKFHLPVLVAASLFSLVACTGAEQQGNVLTQLGGNPTTVATTAAGSTGGTTQQPTTVVQPATATSQATAAATSQPAATSTPPPATTAPQAGSVTRDQLVGVWVVDSSSGGSLAQNGTLEFRRDTTAVVTDRPSTGSTRTAIGQYELPGNNQLRLVLGLGDAIQTFNVTLSGDNNLTLQNDRYRVTLHRQ
jgi:hypothetical protein